MRLVWIANTGQFLLFILRLRFTRNTPVNEIMCSKWLDSICYCIVSNNFRIFDDVWILKNHTGLVLFLEEDHYVAEDFLHMLRLLTAAIPRACSKCSLITLGNYLKNYNFNTDAKKVWVIVLTHLIEKLFACHPSYFFNYCVIFHWASWQICHIKRNKCNRKKKKTVCLMIAEKLQSYSFQMECNWDRSVICHVIIVLLCGCVM